MNSPFVWISTPLLPSAFRKALQYTGIFDLRIFDVTVALFISFVEIAPAKVCGIF